ncbi:MAG: metal-dependent transcriptional regulator [Syntrophales bacterium]|jgi:DtxR family Mn-dependent transcriptional regulator|nr:metal-dependent transcriptional regulator [Syntrophales bacterium]MDY0045084.1 metal-dependent transcriptional regulator [Syntrophales bacterium]
MEPAPKNILSAVMEDYLKAIFTLETLKRYVRVRDIAEKMKVRLPTVTSMVNNLAERNLVKHEKYEHVELTDQGKHIASEIHKRHLTVRKFLIEILRVDERTAEKDACQMEHAVSPLTLKQLTRFMEILENCSDRNKECKGVAKNCAQGFEPDINCLEQMKNLRADMLESKGNSRK